MRLLAAAVLMLSLCSVAHAGNARTARTEWHYRRWVIQQQHLNRQWAQHFQNLRRDQQRAWNREPGYAETRTYQWQQNRQQQMRWYQQQWQNTQSRARRR